MLSFSRTEEFLASPCLLVSRLLWKQKEDSIMARPLHASGKLVLQTHILIGSEQRTCRETRNLRDWEQKRESRSSDS